MTVQYKHSKQVRGIEWCDRTVNPIAGCPHGCEWKMPDETVARCYAEDTAERGVARTNYPNGFAHHYWRPHLMREMLVAGPDLIFVGSMSDMFAAQVPDEQVRQVLRQMREAPQNTFQCLTKAPKRLLKFIDDFPPNMWIGVSSPPDKINGKWLKPEQRKKMLEVSLTTLRIIRDNTDCIVWMSAEPLSWDIAECIIEFHLPNVDWMVIGAASNRSTYYMPDPNHVRRLLVVADGNRTPVFFKGNISGLFQEYDLGDDTLNRWREDFPMRYRNGSKIPAVESRQLQCETYGWTKSRG